MDHLTVEDRSVQMAKVRRKDTKPEMVVRCLIHAMGLRYRLHDRHLPGCPDIVFKRHGRLVFVNGCFWHQHSDSHCRLARLPKTKLDFWLPKFEAIRKRDSENLHRLDQMGWKILVIWECQLKDKTELKTSIREFFE